MPRWKPPASEGAVGVQIESTTPVTSRQSEPFWQDIPDGAVETFQTLVLFKNSHSEPHSSAHSRCSVTGPVGIAQLTGEAAQAGFSPLLEFTGFLSLNLAIINILPLPALDGGRIVFVFLEWVRRGKRVSPAHRGHGASHRLHAAHRPGGGGDLPGHHPHHQRRERQSRETRPSKAIHIGGVTVGGGAPISVQSMTKTDTRDAEATIARLKSWKNTAARSSAWPCRTAKRPTPWRPSSEGISIPLVADIHFDYRLALAALEAGVDGLRLNPGNIGEPDKVAAVVKEARERQVPIRIGVNAGSLPRTFEARPQPCPQRMVDAALQHIEMLEEPGLRPDQDVAQGLRRADHHRGL